MKVVFADTFYCLALVNADDNRHEVAHAYTADFHGNMITTVWVLTELADALAQPATRPAFLQVLAQLRTDPDVSIEPPSAEVLESGLRLYAQRPDKAWSLTDCISFVVMQRLRISEALTGDHRFEQAGFVALSK